MRNENGNTRVRVIVIVLIIFLIIYGVYVYKKGSNKKREFLDEENKVVYREDDFNQTFKIHTSTENFIINNNDENRVPNITPKNLNSETNTQILKIK